MAIEYSFWIAFILAALMTAFAGRGSYDAMAGTGFLPAKTLTVVYTLGAVVCLLLMVFAPALLPDFFPGMVRQISLKAAGVL